MSYPIYIIGAGGIVNDAHLPAYRLAGFTVAGIYDLNREKAAATAAKFGIPIVFDSLEAMLQQATRRVVFDVAVPGSAIAGILQQLPKGAAVLMQKPMGNDLAEAREVLQVTREREQIAGVNFQLRYAPFIEEARRMIAEGQIGQLCGINIQVDVYTPWHLWEFLFQLPRVEILYHSIHYVDLLRSFLGNPRSVYAKTVKHPAMQALASVKTNIIMDYGDWVSANIITNHCHIYGPEQQHASVTFEGTKGAIRTKLGVLMDYPAGVPDSFEYCILKEGETPQWQKKEIAGGWFPHAFIGSMQQVMLAAAGNTERPDNSVEDCIYTMSCVEAAYQSSQQGGVPLL